jgi:hypothetical protein
VWQNRRLSGDPNNIHLEIISFFPIVFFFGMVLKTCVPTSYGGITYSSGFSPVAVVGKRENRYIMALVGNG